MRTSKSKGIAFKGNIAACSTEMVVKGSNSIMWD